MTTSPKPATGEPRENLTQRPEASAGQAAHHRDVVAAAAAASEARPLREVRPGHQRRDEPRYLRAIGGPVGVKHHDDLAMAGVEPGPQGITLAAPTCPTILTTRHSRRATASALSVEWPSTNTIQDYSPGRERGDKQRPQRGRRDNVTLARVGRVRAGKRGTELGINGYCGQQSGKAHGVQRRGQRFHGGRGRGLPRVRNRTVPARPRNHGTPLRQGHTASTFQLTSSPSEPSRSWVRRRHGSSTFRCRRSAPSPNNDRTFTTARKWRILNIYPNGRARRHSISDLMT